MKKIRFAYLSSQDPNNKRVWSGTHYSIYSALQQVGEVEILGPYEPRFRLFICKLINQLCLRFFKKRISYRHSVFVSKGYADFFNRKISAGNFDYIVAPEASCELAFTHTKIPVIYITDGTFAGCLNYHKGLTNLTKKSVYEGNIIEQNAISKSKFTLVSSTWAANSALKDYQCNAAKLFTFPYGANFEKIPAAGELTFEIPDVWRLLFVGVYWQEKGGEYAFNCFTQLADKGYPVELTVLGCIPPENIKHEKMRVVPFIDKNDPQGRERLSEIFRQHHFLILPTRFDCTPIVINEASAYGIPSIVAKTGGVEGHLKEGVNGFLVDYKDTGAGYATVIEQQVQHPLQYMELRRKTRELYDAELNWDTWRQNFCKMLGINS